MTTLPGWDRIWPLLLLILAARVAGEDAPLTVFVLAGQSNMEGQGRVDALPAELMGPQADVLVFDKNVWAALHPGTVPDARSFGPEVGFGQAMAKHLARPIGLIKVAVGGTDLAKDWSPDNKISLYGKLQKKVAAAKQSRPIAIAGMLWMQGEADAKDEAMAKAYQANLEAFIARSRADFGAQAMPFLCGRVNPPGEGKYAFVAQVRAA